MTAQELRASLLREAVTGRLVPQRAEEGSAEALYEEIRQEKARLVAEKKIKKEKPLPPVTEEEQPFPIPASWKWVRLGDIFDIRDGTHDTPAYVNSGIPLITSKNLLNGTIDFSTAKCISSEDAQKINKRSLVNTSDILFAMIGTIGNPVLVKKDREFCIKNMAVFKRLSYQLSNMQFLFYFLLYLQLKIKKKLNGGVQIFVSLKILRNLLFPLPPLAEQKRIVDKLEELLPLVDAYGEAEQRLAAYEARFPDALKRSLLQEAVTGRLVPQRTEEGSAETLYEEIRQEKARLVAEKKIKKTKPLPPVTEEEQPFPIPATWKWIRLGNCGNWYSGTTPSRTRPDYYGGSIPWLKTGDLNDGLITNTSEKITELACKETSVHLNPAGAVLIAMYGATIGRLGLLSMESTTNQACCACTTYSGVFNKFLFFFLLAWRPNFIKQGAGGAQPNISKEKIINTPFPLPPLAEQKRIVDKLEELLALAEHIHEARR